jgi:DedD protein
MATETPEDTSLKRRARRRLIGAIALVLLAVIVLPMIFDSERKPLDQEVTIQIPSQGEYVAPAPKPGTTTPATPPAVMPAAPGTDAKGEPAKADAPKDAKAEAAKAEAPKSEPAKAEPPKAEPPKAAARAEPAKEAAKAPEKTEKAAEKAPAKDAPAKDAKKDDGARALALLNGNGAAPKSEKAAEKASEKPEKAAGSFFVQVAAFSSEEKVQEARDKLSSAGVKTYVEKVTTKSGEVTRVRAGPFASRDAADAVRGKAAGLGYGGAAVVSR